MRQPFVPKDLDQLIRAINGLRRNNHVYSRLMRPDSGAIVAGEYLQSLPPSVLSVLGRRAGERRRPTRGPRPSGTTICPPTTRSPARDCSRSPSSVEAGRSLPGGFPCPVASPCARGPRPAPWLARRRSPSSGGSRAPATSSTATTEGALRRLRRPRASGPGCAASLHDPEAPVRLGARRGTPRACSTPGPGTTARSSRSSPARARSSSTPPSSRCTRWPSGPDGRLYVGTSPDGKVYAVDGAGKATAFFDPEEKYIWALAFDPRGRLRRHRRRRPRSTASTRRARPRRSSTSAETHILSLAVDRKGERLRGQRPARHRLPRRALEEGLRASRLALPRGQGPRGGPDGSVYAPPSTARARTTPHDRCPGRGERAAARGRRRRRGVT